MGVGCGGLFLGRRRIRGSGELRTTDADLKFGERLQWARKSRGLTQGRLADLTDAQGAKMHKTAVLMIEAGRRPATIGEAAAFAEVLGCSVGALLGEEHLAVTAIFGVDEALKPG